MRKVLFILCSFLLVGCASKEEKAINEYFKDILKDPESFVIYSLEEYTEKNKKDDNVYKLDYGAKNSFGAMDRENLIITFVGDKVFKVESEEEYKKSEEMSIEATIDSLAGAY